MFYTILIIIAIIVSILLVFIVLIQNSKGGGLAANFAAGNQIFGVRQTADTLEKATWYLSITLGLLCILATSFPPTASTSRTTESTVQQSGNFFQNSAAQPGFGVENQAETQEQPISQPQEQTQQQGQETSQEENTNTAE
jgi:preprotein translocase subunit SecG